MRSNERHEAIDFLRGAAIVMVVLGHALIAQEKTGAFGNSAAIAAAMVDFFYAVHIPAILAVSGFLSRDHERTTRQFLSTSAKWILFPYVLWSVITVFLQHLAPSANSLVPLTELLYIGWSPVLHLWFLQTLFLVKAAAYLLSRLGVDRLRAALFLSAASFVAYPLLADRGGPALNGLVCFLLFYAMGVFFSALSEREGSPAARLEAHAGKIAIGAFCGVALLIASARLGWFGAPRPVFGVTFHLAGLLGIAGLAALAPLLGRSRLLEALAVCGRYSMAIYVMHTIFMAATRHALPRPGAIDPWAAALACAIVGVVLPVLAQKITDRRGMSPYLGIRPVAPSPAPRARSPAAAPLVKA